MRQLTGEEAKSATREPPSIASSPAASVASESVERGISHTQTVKTKHNDPGIRKVFVTVEGTLLLFGPHRFSSTTYEKKVTFGGALVVTLPPL